MFTWTVITDHKRGRRGQPLFLILTLKGARSRLCIETMLGTSTFKTAARFVHWPWARLPKNMWICNTSKEQRM